jgi:hypothetical protein
MSNPASPLSAAQSELDQAVSGFRSAGTTHHLPRALITRAWHRSLTGRGRGESSAESDLEEAWEIASRGAMRLFQADILLTRARLFGVRHSSFVTGHSSLGTGDQPSDQGPRTSDQGPMTNDYPWGSPAADLAAAEELITTCGYHRRDEELADAKRALLGQA